MTLFLSDRFVRSLLLLILSVTISQFAFAQPEPSRPDFRSQEISEIDGYPVVMRNLPDWESVRPRARFAHDPESLRSIVGDRTFLSAIDMDGGTEAAFAEYDAGKLLLVEYMSPQASIDADNRITSLIDGDASVVYRRIGNYNVLVFDIVDRSAADALLDMVKYEKQIHWLGDNPFRISEERAFVMTTRDVFISTVMVIVGGFGVAILSGLIVGFLYFYIGDRRRRVRTAFSDAGGMTRLNLDGFSTDS